MRKIIIAVLISFTGLFWLSCSKYLDIVPDNIATIDYAFRLRETAKKYLYTCYSSLVEFGSMSHSPGLMTGDELWLPNYPFNDGPEDYAWEIARGIQSSSSPNLNYWSEWNKKDPWRSIRDCNIFLENIHKVPDMEEQEKIQWAAEVKFLKAYYHFFLITMYGPIPVVKNNLEVSADPESMKVSRIPLDSAFNYIGQLIDEAAVDLPDRVADDNAELGRITRPIALAMKAKIMVYAASPLFNGNKDYSGFKNYEGQELFNPVYDENKWVKAATACKEAIDVCEAIGFSLYRFIPPTLLSFGPQSLKKIELRSVMTEKWNQEIIWAYRGGTNDLQIQATIKGLDPSFFGNPVPRGNLGVPMKIAYKFYTKNGVPINEDKTWSFINRYNLRTATANDKFYLKEGYTTAEFNFDREPRFYADLAFDGSIWEAQGKTNDNEPFYVQAKFGQTHGKKGNALHSITGYWPKKLVHYSSTLNANTYPLKGYTFPVMRLSDLYLLYAEALNEAYGPSDEAYMYVNRIRERAMLPTVQDAWTNFSLRPEKYTTKDGFREIIQNERTIELAFESQRIFDLKRWKTAPEELNGSINGWDMDQENIQAYYREKQYFQMNFSLKDYFWPIPQEDLLRNKRIKQIPGWD